MEKTCVSHKPGDIVQLAGIDLVVLEDLSPFSGENEAHDLFVLALESQGERRFGNTNNYSESDLKVCVEGWLYRLTEKMTEQGLDADLIRSRTLDLTTMDGHGKYGELSVKAAPLTMDEARKYADIIPNCEDAYWLATGWGGPEFYGATIAWGVNSYGGWYYYFCSGSCAVRPALVISSFLLASTELDLSKVPTDDLLSELRQRIGEE